MAVAGAAVAAGIGFAVAVTAGDPEEKGESLTPETAEAGQCVDIAEAAGRIDITEARCSLPHDAEIVLTTEVGDAIAGPAELDDAEGVCRGLMDATDVTQLDDSEVALEWGLLIDEPSNIDPYDRLVCYVRSPDGTLTDPLLG
ncbi:MAG: hypothetical protein JWN84_145 [Nocardioides sp.]|nr:hypothetical protein [Nocardioides sp.]